MSSLDLTDEERALITQAAAGHGTLMNGVFYFSILAPPVVFAAYGLIKKDYVALFVAFASLLLLVSWRLVADASVNRVFRELAKKIKTHQENS